MGLKKKFLKSKPVCKVTFSLPKELADNAKEVHLVGEFNDWNETADKMKQLKSGEFKIELSLESEKQYQFRYLLDGETWVNDDSADAYSQTEFADAQNSVVATQEA